MIELMGGPLDGEKIEPYPEMNRRFYIERGKNKVWYQTFDCKKAYYEKQGAPMIEHGSGVEFAAEMFLRWMMIKNFLLTLFRM